MTIAWFGWMATAVFTTSYFVAKTSTLKQIQAAAACLWIVYGIKTSSTPLIVSNLIVVTAVLITSLRNRPPNANSPRLLGAQETEPEV
ncbi:MAG: hypothetical protein ACYCSP_07780 [Acidobacteriaceae bacterium]